jgi:hypothetical protein
MSVFVSTSLGRASVVQRCATVCPEPTAAIPDRNAALTEWTMSGIRLRKCAMAFLLIVTTGSFAQSPPQPPPSLPVITNHASDSYAIYSLLVPHSTRANPSQRVAIADTTINVDDMQPATEPESELQPPPGSENAFHEALQDFYARRQERVQLQQRFRLDRPYELLNAEQVAAFRKSPAGYSSLTFFSEVYFNSTQTAALIYTDSVCATPCANSRWIYLEKRDGQWVRRFSSVSDPADTYAIYSLLLRDDPYPGLPQKEGTLAIADTTLNITDMNPAIPPDGQLQPPPNNADAFREAVQDFRARRFERLQLKRGFHLDADYTLLNPGDVATYKQTQSGYPAVNFFSEVYFNGKQTAALVYRNVFCGRLCANGQWIYLEKQGNQWVRRSGLNI